MRPRLKLARSALPIIAAHPLRERQKPFDDPDWLFELKYDGYRALLYIERSKGRLISRNGRHMKRFDALAAALVPPVKAQNANRLYIKAVTDRIRREVNSRRIGDVVEAGVMISNSEVGLGSVV